MRHLLVVDYSNILCMAWYPALDAQEADAVKYPAEKVVLVNIDGKLATIREELDKYGINDFHTVFVEDRHAKAKFELFPEYKGERDRSRPKPPRELVKAHLKLKGFRHWVHSPDHEADDAIAAFVKLSKRNEMPAIIISGDKDTWQLLNPPAVAIFNPYTNRFIDAHEDVPKKFNGLSDPKFIPICKALWGDTSDNIPNVMPRMQKHLVPIIEQSDGSWSDFCVRVTMTPTLSKRCVELWSENLQRAAVNHDLVKLNPDCPIVFDPE